ncbi:hypothetical protein CRUP_009330, partial [Coryphaenoides rupestris]
MLVESSSNVEMNPQVLRHVPEAEGHRGVGRLPRLRHRPARPHLPRRTSPRPWTARSSTPPSEIQFLLSCSEADENEMINFEEFADRFQEPAKDIGFNIAVLLTNLSEHVPHDTRLQNFLGQAESILNYFRPFLGRIEIMGASRKIERIYFEISEANRNQWEMPQVRESKRQFIFDVVNEGGESEKMEMFVNFCEDTIFEMNIAASISEPEAEAEEEDDEEEEEGGGGGGGGGGNEVESGEGEEANGEASPPESSSAFADFLKSVVLFFNMFTFRNLRRKYRKLRKMTVKEMVVALVTFVYTVLMGILLFVYSVCKGFFTLIWKVLFGGGLVEGAKKMTVTEILASMPDPTQDEVHGELPPEPGARGRCRTRTEPRTSWTWGRGRSRGGGGEERGDGQAVRGGQARRLGRLRGDIHGGARHARGNPLLKRKLVTGGSGGRRGRGRRQQSLSRSQKFLKRLRKQSRWSLASVATGNTQRGKGREGKGEGGGEGGGAEPKAEKVKTKAKKEKKVAGEGFELWNELDVQRNKFM